MRRIIISCAVMIGLTTNLYAALPDIEAAVMNKDYAEVRQLASQVLKDSNDPAQRTEAQYYFALAQLRLGQYADARRAFQMVMDAHPARDIYDRADLGLTEGFYMAGFYKDALDAAGQLLKHSPHSSFLSLIYLKIARSNLKLMRWEKANEYLNKVINEFPKSPEAPIARQLLEEKQYFAVQVGSFLDKGRAITLIDDLKAGGQYAYIVETASADGQKFYRVRVGQMSSLKDAENLEKSLAKLGYPTLIYP